MQVVEVQVLGAGGGPAGTDAMCEQAEERFRHHASKTMGTQQKVED